MSKMSQLHAELSEQAVNMGYSSLEYATEIAGCEVDYEKGKLIPPEEAAHNAQLSERDKIVEELTILRDDAADLAMGTGTHTDEWSKVALLADKVANYIKKEVK